MKWLNNNWNKLKEWLDEQERKRMEKKKRDIEKLKVEGDYLKEKNRVEGIKAKIAKSQSIQRQEREKTSDNNYEDQFDRVNRMI